MSETNRRPWLVICIAVGLLALPALTVHAWMAWTFPLYRAARFGQDVVFAFAWCGLLVCIARWRLLHVLSVPLTLLAYLVWLFLLLGEGVSYYLQADTFNARFFAHLDPHNLGAGMHAYPAMIGGGVVLLALMVVLCAALLAWLRRRGRRAGVSLRNGPLLVALVILVLTVAGVDSSPRRLGKYLASVHESAQVADTAQGQAVAALLDLHPTPTSQLAATPGKNVVFLYLESLERIYWDPKVFPGLTPNLDRLRGQGLDFSGFETFRGASYTIAGMFASQCGVPLFSSPFAGLDYVAGNDTDTATFHPGLACFGDVLHRAGYKQVYMAGAPITFSNKGLFYRLHGYDEALGLRELESQAGGKLPESGWGLYDSELFRLLLQRYQKLEATNRPFNLSTITLDTHPPDGRPSPGCPKYAASNNSMLQAVHCTDYLVGKFIDALSKEPDWKNTVVVLMSDHLMMRNNAEPLYPKGYHRKVAMVVLNAGQGVRPVRMYHMDVAPTLLDLMGVHTNATFIAGKDRSAVGAADSALVDNRLDVAVLRKALWSRSSALGLCRKDTLVGRSGDGAFHLGGRELPLSLLGQTAVGVHDGQVLEFFNDDTNAKLVLVNSEDETKFLAGRGDTSVLMIRPLPRSQRQSGLFSVDWLGRKGAIAHIADVPSLRGLTVTSPDCAALVHRADTAPAGSALDFSARFKVDTAPIYPSLPTDGVKFSKRHVLHFERGLGWLPPENWGSYASGAEAVLGFRLPEDACGKAELSMQLDPKLPSSRPALNTQVWINGKYATTWYFRRPPAASGANADPGDDHSLLEVTAPIAPSHGNCNVQVDLRFIRPNPGSATNDARNLQLRVMRMQVKTAAAH